MESIFSSYFDRIPQSLRAIDPAFVDSWLAPCYEKAQGFVPERIPDFSPLAQVSLADLDHLKQLYSGDPQLQELIDYAKSAVPLTPEKALPLLPLSAAEDQDARNRLVDGYLHLLLTLAHQYRHTGFPFALLIWHARDGLYQAAKTFVPGTPGGFSGWAVWHIRRELIWESWERLPDLQKQDIPPYQPSGTRFGHIYRALRDQQPDCFQVVLGQMLPYEAEILEALYAREGSFPSYREAAQRFYTTGYRIHTISRKFLNLLHSGGYGQLLDSLDL